MPTVAPQARKAGAALTKATRMSEPLPSSESMASIPGSGPRPAKGRDDFSRSLLWLLLLLLPLMLFRSNLFLIQPNL